MLCAVIVFSFSGCFQSGPKYDNIDTAQSVDADSISQKNYDNNLDGLVNYFKALHYLPVTTTPTQMLAEVIGAVKGYRYIYTVNGSQTVVELYEYNPAAMNDTAKRVLGEIRETGSFHLFNKEGVDKDTTYTAYLSDNGKYMMIYTDNSNNDGNLIQAKSAQKALKDFYADTAETSDAKENSNASQTETSENKQNSNASGTDGSST